MKCYRCPAIDTDKVPEIVNICLRMKKRGELHDLGRNVYYCPAGAGDIQRNVGSPELLPKNRARRFLPLHNRKDGYWIQFFVKINSAQRDVPAQEFELFYDFHTSVYPFPSRPAYGRLYASCGMTSHKATTARYSFRTPPIL